jgi:hypothetical protein
MSVGVAAYRGEALQARRMIYADQGWCYAGPSLQGGGLRPALRRKSH